MTNTAVATEPRNGLTEQKKKSIVRRLFTRVWWLMFCTSYTKQQGTSTVWQLEPFIADIYGKDTDEYYDALQRHQNFFNTTPMFASFIYAIVISMEYERKAALDAGEEFDDNSIEAIKVALMGPLAGIGDSIQLSCLRVIATGVAIGFSQQGSWLGPILFALVYNVPLPISGIVPLSITLGSFAYLRKSKSKNSAMVLLAIILVLCVVFTLLGVTGGTVA